MPEKLQIKKWRKKDEIFSANKQEPTDKTDVEIIIFPVGLTQSQ